MGEKERGFWKATPSLRNSPSSFALKQNLMAMKNNIFPDECQTLPWFQSVLWDCLGGGEGANFQHGGKFVPQNSPTMHFKTISTQSPATSKWLDLWGLEREGWGSFLGYWGSCAKPYILKYKEFIQHRTSVVIQSLYFAVFFVQFFFRYLAK